MSFPHKWRPTARKSRYGRPVCTRRLRTSALPAINESIPTLISDAIDHGPQRGQLAGPGPGQDPANAPNSFFNFVRPYVEFLQQRNIAVPAQPAHNEPQALWREWARQVLALSRVREDEEHEETQRRRRREDEVLEQLVEAAQRSQPVSSSSSGVSPTALCLGVTDPPMTASDNAAGSGAAAGSASGAGASSATRPQEAAAVAGTAAGAAVAGSAEAAGTLRHVRDPPTQGMGPLAAGADPERTGRGRTPAAGLGGGAASGSPHCGCKCM